MVGGPRKGHPWVCSVRTLLDQRPTGRLPGELLKLGLFFSLGVFAEERCWAML